jgi:two-component system response regulator PilR (NtrC family)
MNVLNMKQSRSGGVDAPRRLGELSADLQPKLLRALERKEVKRVGGNEVIPVDVRVVAATNRNLAQEVKDGRFREDLYYRLNVVQLDLPPLRERAEDIPMLAQHYLERYTREYTKPLRGITPEAMGMLRAYRFPGNVRELQNLLERAVVLESGSFVTPGSLPERVQGELRAPEGSGEGSAEEPAEEFRLDGGIDLEARLNAMERRYLEQALKATGNNYTQAARLLGVTFRSFRYRLAKYNMNEGE